MPLPTRPALLAGGLVLVAAFVAGRAGRDNPALAAPLGAPPLGPASGLVLEGDDGTAVTLRASGGRVAWDDEATHRAWSEAYVDLGPLIPVLLGAEEFKAERETLRDELRERDRAFRDRLETLGRAGEGLDQSSPQFQQAYENYMNASQEFQAFQEEAIARSGALDAKHLEIAYGRVVDAVEVVAERLSIDIVHKFTPARNAFEAKTPPEALTAIRVRPVLRLPAELDITDAVKRELGID